MPIAVNAITSKLCLSEEGLTRLPGGLLQCTVHCAGGVGVGVLVAVGVGGGSAKIGGRFSFDINIQKLTTNIYVNRKTSKNIVLKTKSSYELNIFKASTA